MHCSRYVHISPTPGMVEWKGVGGRDPIHHDTTFAAERHLEQDWMPFKAAVLCMCCRWSCTTSSTSPPTLYHSNAVWHPQPNKCTSTAQQV
jgi:hypothetical protein